MEELLLEFAQENGLEESVVQRFLARKSHVETLEGEPQC